MPVLYGRYTGFAVLKCLLYISIPVQTKYLYIDLILVYCPALIYHVHGTFGGDFNWWFDDFCFNVHSTNYNHEYHEAMYITVFAKLNVHQFPLHSDNHQTQYWPNIPCSKRHDRAHSQGLRKHSKCWPF